MSNWFRSLALACAALIPAVVLPGEVVRHELSSPGSRRSTEVLETPAGDLFVKLFDDGQRDLFTLYRLTEKYALGDAVFVPEGLGSVMPLGARFIGLRHASAYDAKHPRLFAVVSFDGRSQAGEDVLYETESPVDSVYLRPTFRHDAVYVLNKLVFEPRYELRRVSPAGTLVWKIDVDAAHFRAMQPLPNGVAILHSLQRERGSRLIHVANVSDAGTVRWRTSYEQPIDLSQESYAWLPPDKLLVMQARRSQSVSARLLLIDLADGVVREGAAVAAVGHLQSTQEGVLLFDNLARHPYIALLGRSGSLLWERRLPIHSEHGGWLTAATITPDQRLLMFGNYVLPRSAGDRTWNTGVNLLVTDANRPAETPSCLEPSPTEIRVLEHQLQHAHGVRVQLGTTQSHLRDLRNPPCAKPAESDYRRFVRELRTALATPPARTDMGAWQVGIAVGDVATPVVLAQHQMNSGDVHGPKISVGLHARADAAGSVATYLRQVVWPYLRSIDAIEARFRELTGQLLTIQLREGSFGTTTLQQLETKAAAVLTETEKLPAEVLQDARQKRSYTQYARLDLDGFGTSDDMRPFSELRTTLLRLLEPGQSTK